MKTILSLGIMTGTSCDGADMAVLKISAGPNGSNKSEDAVEKVLFTDSKDFPAKLRKNLLKAQTNALNTREQAFLTQEYSKWIADTCAAFLKRKKINTEKLILSIHGQTLWHEPPVSVQILDPVLVAARTGCTVVSSFRQADLARGGQGAPLVPYYHWLKANSLPEFQKKFPFCIHNIGGIANVTLMAEKKSQIQGFDSGPGNALIDLAVWLTTHHKEKFDNQGKTALENQRFVNWSKISALAKKYSYFSQKPPKSTGRELFNEKFLKNFLEMSDNPQALVANATAFTAHTMALTYKLFILPKNKIKQIYLAGGGAENHALLFFFKHELQRLTKQKIPVEKLPENFAPPKFLEALAFARLGYEAIQQKPVSLAQVTGAKADSSEVLISPGDNFSKILKELF